jgi:hypothetical protein
METILVEIDKVTHNALAKYAAAKGMSVDAAADYLLSYSMIVFLDGCSHVATQMTDKLEALKKAIDEKSGL